MIRNNNNNNNNSNNNKNASPPTPPREKELLILIIDHLEDLSCMKANWLESEGLDPAQLKLAAEQLKMALLPPIPLQLLSSENDCWDMEERLERFRFYSGNGVGSEAVSLSVLVSAGARATNSRSKIAADLELDSSPLFQDFLKAVVKQGFFAGSSPSNYDIKYQTVVDKFRSNQPQNTDNPNPSIPSLSAEQRFKNFTQPIHRQNETLATKFKNEGNDAMAESDFYLALHYYTKAIQMTPTSSQQNMSVYYCNRSAAFLSLKHYEDAKGDAKVALKLNESYVKAYIRLALAHFHLKEYTESRDIFLRAQEYSCSSTEMSQIDSYLEKIAVFDPASPVKEVRGIRSPTLEKFIERGSPSKHLSARFLNRGSPTPSSPSKSVVRRDSPNKAERGSSIRAHRAFNSAIQPSTVSQESSIQSKSNARKEEEQIVQEKDDLFEDPEAYKVQGNNYMKKKEYALAVDAYSNAIDIVTRLGANETNLHVYYSNRAAAHCYLQNYNSAKADAEKSLLHDSEYGKAYARLGLSNYFLGNYEYSIEAYEKALLYDDESSRRGNEIYLKKARAKLNDRL